MNEGRRREVIVLMATDPTFAERVRAHPDAIAAEYGLDAADLAVLESLRNDSSEEGAVKLNPRLSKSSLFFGGAGHAMGHAEAHSSHHEGASEFSLLKCDGRAGLLKCNGYTGPLTCNPHSLLLCNGDPGPGVANAHAGLLCDSHAGLVCNSHAGLVCNSHAGLVCNSHAGLVCDSHAGLVCDSHAGLLCNSHAAHDGAASGGDGGDGLRPIVIPPGSLEQSDTAGTSPVEAQAFEKPSE